MRFGIWSTFLVLFSVSQMALAQSGDGIDFFERLAEQLAGASSEIVQVIPNAVNSKDMTTVCDPHRFEEMALSKNLKPREFTALVKKYFSKCERELISNSPTGALGLLQFARYKYLFLSHPSFKAVKIPLDDGTRVPAVLAVKEGNTPRPLVVIRCGVYCSADESSVLVNYMILLFDQTPFNVLFLANQTGMDYIRTNKKVTLGGWSEGYESLLVGKYMLEKSTLRDRISSVHLMGISLGGNAAVIGAAYNDRFPLAGGKKVFNSVTAICPVVDLKPTLDHLYESPLIGPVFTWLTRDHFSGARNHVTDVPDLLKEEVIPERKEMPTFIGTLASTSLQRRGIASTVPSFFENNNFWNLSEDVQTPTLVWASKDDMVVNNDINGRQFELRGRYQNSEDVGVVNLNYGNHCGFSSVYGFQASASVLRTFVLNHSPEFVDRYKLKQMNWTFGAVTVPFGYQHIGQQFEFKSKSDKVKISYRLFNKRASVECEKADPLNAPLHCVWKKTYSIPVTSLKALGARVPKTDEEAQGLTREFNTKVEFVSKKGRSLLGTRDSDVVLKWRAGF